MTEQERIDLILKAFEKEYGTDCVCYLNHKNAYELLVATILSAQCTDARVNTVTPILFEKYPNPEALAEADIKDVEDIIRPLGFFHSKAGNIIGAAKGICERYGNEVPAKPEELITLPGVGRKTANVIRGNIFNEPCIVVDTHVKRISKKLGVTDKTEPVDIEFDLMKKIPKDYWILWNIYLIRLGRTVCKAPNPKCQECFLRQYCLTGKSHEEL